MFNIVLDTPAELQIIDTAKTMTEARRKVVHHTTGMIVGEEGILFGTRALTDGYAITDVVGEEIGRIILELKYSKLSEDSWSYGA